MFKNASKFLLISTFTALTLMSGMVAAADVTPKFDCVLTDSEDGASKSTFGKDTTMVYLLCESSDVKKGESYKGTWIATDTNNVAPANYKIDEKAVAVTDDLKDGQVWKAKFSLSKPDKGWPVGKYRVELYSGDTKLLQKYDYTIQ